MGWVFKGGVARCARAYRKSHVNLECAFLRAQRSALYTHQSYRPRSDLLHATPRGRAGARDAPVDLIWRAVLDQDDKAMAGIDLQAGPDARRKAPGKAPRRRIFLAPPSQP